LRPIAEVLAAHRQYIDDCFTEAPKEMPVKIYVALRGRDTNHDWEIPDSDTKIL
jgi:hypothetical protein